MDQFFTSLNKRQTMLLLTAVTFGGQEGPAALEYLPEEQAELLSHRAQELQQVPRDKRIPLLVQEIKRLVKDQRGRLWSADPARLASLLRRERSALVEIVLRALPADLAQEVQALLPNRQRVRLTREVRPQVLDIVRWKLEELLARDAAPPTAFKFTDVILLRSRELFTLVDRLGARVLGPALAGLPDEEREQLLAPVPPHLKQLASKAVAANVARRLNEENARAYLGQYGAMEDLSAAIRKAGTQRLARACVHQSPEFAARMVERHRGDFGQLFAHWVREERNRPPSRGDGGRADIVMDMERLAARGLIDRPVRLRPPTLKPPAALGAPPGRAPALRPPALRPPPAPRDSSADAPRRSVEAPRRSVEASPAPPRRNTVGRAGLRRPSVETDTSPGRPPLEEGQEGSRVIRSPPRLSAEQPRGGMESNNPQRRPRPTVGARPGSSGRGPGDGTR